MIAVLPVPSRVGVRWRKLVEWGTFPRPPSGQADDRVGLREDIHDRPRARRLQLISSQSARTVQASFPQDAQVPSEDEDGRPFLAIPTQNRFQWLNEDFSTRCAKREELEKQQTAVLDALEFDLTMGDSDTASVAGGSERPFTVPDPSGEQLDDHDRIPRRRLSIVGVPQSTHVFQTSVQNDDADNDDEERERDGASECEEQEETVPYALVEDPVHAVHARNISVGLQSLDEVDLKEVFMMRPIVMKSAPPFMRSCLKNVMRLACKTIVQGRMVNNVELETQGWKLFLLFPRMLLFRPPRGGLVPRERLIERVNKFRAGEWSSLVEESLVVAASGHVSSRRRRRRQQVEDVERRANRASSLVQMGELSAGRQALEAAVVAPGTQQTLDLLQDSTRRPPHPRVAVPNHIAELQPEVPLDLDFTKFKECVHSARRGAAAGPSGMTATPCWRRKWTVVICTRWPLDPVERHLKRMGRMTALQKDDGGVRGIVVGDSFRRLVARTIAKQFSSRAESATAPFQFALSTRAGCECVTHVIRAATDINDRTTIVSVDGIGACDSISRNSMLEGLHRMVDGDQMMLFVRLFYGSPSVCLWEDDMGDTHEIMQGEGGEQGDPLMPLLFSLGQHSALLAINAKLKEGESLIAFLDDLYVLCSPRRVREVHKVIQDEL